MDKILKKTLIGGLCGGLVGGVLGTIGAPMWMIVLVAFAIGICIGIS